MGREAGFLAVAAALHASVWLAARTADVDESALGPSGLDPMEVIEIESAVTNEAQPRAAEQAPKAEGPDAVPHAESAASDRSRSTLPRGGREGTRAAPSDAPTSASSEPVIRAPSDEYGESIVSAPPLPGIDAPVWSMPFASPQGTGAPPAPTEAPAIPRTDPNVAGRVLAEAQRSKDKAIGIDLPAAGTVASIVADAARNPEAPRTGRATFEVRLDARGRVQSIRVVSSSTSPGEWESTAAAARARLAGRELVMSGAFAAGALVYVDVTSKMQLPSGGKAIASGPPPGSVGGGVAFDVSDIGARPTRVVSSSFRAVPVR